MPSTKDTLTQWTRLSNGIDGGRLVRGGDAPVAALRSIPARTAGGRPSCAACTEKAAWNRCATTVPSTAMPRTPPICWAVLPVADARPTRGGGTLPTMAAIIGVMVRPTPAPRPSRIGHHVPYGVSAETRVNASSVTATTVMPRPISQREPNRPASRPASGAHTVTDNTAGSRRRPAASGEYCWILSKNSDRKKNEPSSPNPNRNPQPKKDAKIAQRKHAHGRLGQWG